MQPINHLYRQADLLEEKSASNEMHQNQEIHRNEHYTSKISSQIGGPVQTLHIEFKKEIAQLKKENKAMKEKRVKQK
jgi:hypothetical protein